VTLPDLAERASVVAPRLLGCVLRHGEVAVRITEVEAYEGTDDPASHAYRGPTQRTGVMFGPPGHLYVYFSYGMHWCANVVCGPDGTASAVLLRAGEVVAGHDLARERRGPRVRDRRLACGPACLTRALGIAGDAQGAYLLRPGAPALEAGGPVGEVAQGPRVGISQAVDRPWRFWVAGDPTVSAYKRSPRAVAGW
jgi:DNA-3-methyladenine glycosylase